jgi:hypothetical protein
MAAISKPPNTRSRSVGRPYHRLTARQTLLLILVPMLLTAAGQRLYLHLVRVQHIYPAGYLVHHLFTGALLVIAAGFVLAFGARNRLLAILAPMTLGVGSAMVLDEVVYLIATQATDDDYVSGVSLGGSVVLISLAVVTLLVLYRLHRDDE